MIIGKNSSKSNSVHVKTAYDMPFNTKTQRSIFECFVGNYWNEYFKVEFFGEKRSLHVRVEMAYNVPLNTRTVSQVKIQVFP